MHIDFPPHVTVDGEVTTWTFARVLLGEGLRAHAGIGNARVRPGGSAHTYVEFHAPQGKAVLRFTTADLTRFLARTYTVVAPDEETVGAEPDHGLVALFGGGCDPRRCEGRRVVGSEGVRPGPPTAGGP